MKIVERGDNWTVVETPDGTQRLFSYRTLVAAFVPGRGYVRTAQHYSRTTSKHINQWIGSYGAETITQAELEALA